MKKIKDYEIKRKDGIEYTRTCQINNFDCNLNIRYNKNKIEKLKEIAKSRDVKYNELVRTILDAYIDSYEKLTKSK